jgi:hypothetical protein
MTFCLCALCASAVKFSPLPLPDANHEFNRAWLAAAQRVISLDGQIL